MLSQTDNTLEFMLSRSKTPDIYRIRNVRQWFVWLTCFAVIFLLGIVRNVTEAEFAFSSFAILPIAVTAWFCGRKAALTLSCVATAMWAYTDLTSGQQFLIPLIPWINALTRLILYGLISLLVAHVRMQYSIERERATLDVLTGLLNRRAFLEVGNAEVTRALRYAHSMAVIFIDLDNFKQLNDSRGHEVGDHALRATSEALRGILRSSDRACRLGGDEFSVLVPEIRFDAAVDVGIKIADALKIALNDFFPVTASIGVAWFDSGETSFSEMLKASDHLMYEVKKGGKGNVLARHILANELIQLHSEEQAGAMAINPIQDD